MEYTNKNFYDYIEKIDSTDNPLHEIYQKILTLLQKDGFNKPISDDGMEAFFEIFEIRKHKLKEDGFSDLERLLSYDSAFRRIMKNNNGGYSIYPQLRELPTETDLLQYYSLTLKMDVKEIVTFLTPQIDSQKTELKKSEIDTYYGSPKYLILRTKAIYDSIVLLNSRDDVENHVLVNQTLSKVTFLLNMMLKTTGIENSKEAFLALGNYDYQLHVSKTEYDSMRNYYIEVLECESNLLNVSKKLWQSYASKNNGVLIHQLTREAVESDKMDKICTSFYSDNVHVITEYEDGNIGYAYPMDIDTTFSVCETDVGSWRVTKEEYIERGIPENWQLDETNLWYEDPHHSKLFSPEYIENQIINNDSFAEIIIDNRKGNVRPLYCFYTSNATDEQIEEINRLARLQGLEVKYLGIKEEKKFK